MLKLNLATERLTSIFTPFYRHIGEIRIWSNSMGHIQTTITLLICLQKVQNLCSSSSSECPLSKIFRPHYHSKVII